jgi:hypothetical protein
MTRLMGGGEYRGGDCRGLFRRVDWKPGFNCWSQAGLRCIEKDKEKEKRLTCWSQVDKDKEMKARIHLLVAGA